MRLLSTLPGVGQRSALRMAFHILKSESHQVEQLARSLVELKRNVRFCSECGALAADDLCDICQDEKRDRHLLCVVEEPGDVIAINQTGEFSGVYHVLMGALSPLDGIGPEDLRIRELMQRIRKGHLGSGSFEEVFIATNPTLEGDATASYLNDRLREEGVRITRISHGIATGAQIEYADRGTLGRSIRSRTEMN